MLTQLEYGACTKHTGGFGSTACIMKGTDGPTADDVFCICPETQSLAQPSKKKLPECSRHPDTKECWKRDVNEQCECPAENSLAESKKTLPYCTVIPGKGCHKEDPSELCICPPDHANLK